MMSVTGAFLGLIVGTAGTAAAAYAPNCFWGVAISDMSPLVQYEPLNLWTSVPDGISYQHNLPKGSGPTTPSRRSNSAGAKVTVEYPGTRFTASGQAGGAATALEFKIDGATQPQPIIKSGDATWETDKNVNDLPFGMHSATLGLNPSSIQSDADFGLGMWSVITGVVAET